MCWKHNNERTIPLNFSLGSWQNHILSSKIQILPTSRQTMSSVHKISEIHADHHFFLNVTHSMHYEPIVFCYRTVLQLEPNPAPTFLVITMTFLFTSYCVYLNPRSLFIPGSSVSCFDIFWRLNCLYVFSLCLSYLDECSGHINHW